MTKSSIHLKMNKFKELTLKSKVNKDDKNNQLDILSFYHLPDGYEESNKKYPIVFVQSGGGLRYWEKVNSLNETVNNAGANIAFDQSVISWISNGYEDVIVVSVHNRGKYAPAGYYAHAEINQVADYFIKNFKVDKNRVYYSGNSMGSLLGYQTIGSRPDLWAAFMPCNGLSHFGDITTEEGKRKFQEEIANVMIPFAKEKIAVKWQLGDEDEGASGSKGQLFYDFMYEHYKNEGMSNEDIDKILQKNIYYEEDYVNNEVLNNDGTYNPHLATKLAYQIDKDNFMPWLLSQSK